MITLVTGSNGQLGKTIQSIVKNTSEFIFTDWITNGVPIGDTNLLPPFPIFNGNSSLGTPDLTLQIPTYTSTANSNSDDYVCFSISSGKFIVTGLSN